MITSEQLKQRQSLPLEAKIILSQERIKQWYSYWNGDVYVSFSGGKDSTVLLNLVRELYPNVPAVFIDTGLEYPEIREFVKTIDNVVWIKPKMRFNEVIEEYGYPVISKTISNIISTAKEGNTRWERLHGTFINKNTGKLSLYNCSKYKYLLDAPFKISDRCCYFLKKQPVKEYTKSSNKKPMLALMASESLSRKNEYYKTGCNAFNLKFPQSQPIAFWTEQDILLYLNTKNINYSSIYGNIVSDINKNLYTTKEQRTGCMFCMFGVHLEKQPNRFQRMQISHPKQYNYCINKLGCGKVLDYIGVPYTNKNLFNIK